jgi:hypothetical protein
MDVFKRQVLIMIFAITLGIGFALSGLTDKIHNYSAQNLLPIFKNEKNNNAEKLAESLGYFVELIFASIFLLTPICGISGIWFLKIAYELSLGKNSMVNVFLIHPLCNIIMALLCFILFFYCLFSQYKWAIRLTEPKQKITKDKDLTRFI